MEKVSKIISRREFEWLSSFSKLTPEEEKKINDYRNHQKEKIIKQHPKEPQKKPVYIDGKAVDKKNVWNAFKYYYKIISGGDFITTEDSVKNLEPLMKYFIQDPSFFDCQNLITNISGSELEPSFKKGLLIVGGYGNGKTTMMKALSKTFAETTETAKTEFWKSGKNWNEMRFNCYNANDIVTEYESLREPEHKDFFYKKYTRFRLYFDDVKNEKTASNFGKTEIMREIIEKRYNLDKKTFITCNYNQDFPNELSPALDEFGVRYGGHIYDRLFEMFNIIEFSGKTFRK